MTIFWRIFLGFWVATTVLILLVFADNVTLPARLLSAAAPKIQTAPVDLRGAVDAFEQRGAGAFRKIVDKTPAVGRNVMLFGADSRVLIAGNVPDTQWIPLVSAVLKDKTPEMARYDAKIALASPIESSSGHQYVILLSIQKPLYARLYRPTFWTKVAFAVLPETLICLGLALLITRPLSSLRQTTRRLASGDLSARPPAEQKKRRDEIGQLSRDFDTMADRIEELLVAQRRFVASVAHELGAPLTRLQLAATLLHRDLSPAHSEGLAPIEREADRLSHLVQELLFLASLEEGVIPGESFVPMSLAALCREIVRDNAAEAEEKDCAISLDCEEVEIDAAPQTIRRAIENVFRNAIKHSSKASSISLSCKASRTPGYAIVEVKDSGVGIPEEMLSKIFQPFVRIPGQGGKSKGTGLGLTIASDAVALHGGTISAANDQGGGLSVTISLPCKRRSTIVS